MLKEKRQGLTDRITEGVIWKQILLFFFPILLGSLFQQLYNTADAVRLFKQEIMIRHAVCRLKQTV